MPQTSTLQRAEEIDEMDQEEGEAGTACQAGTQRFMNDEQFTSDSFAP